MAYEQYDDVIDRDEYDYKRRDFLRTMHEPSIPENLKNDPTWKAVELIMAKAYDYTGDNGGDLMEPVGQVPTISEMLDYCVGIVIPRMESTMKADPRNRFYAREVLALVSAIRHIKRDAPHLLSEDMDAAIRQAAEEGNRDYYSQVFSRIERGRGAERARTVKHSGSKLISPHGSGEWQLHHAGRNIVLEGTAEPSRYRFLRILIANRGQYLTPQQIKAHVDGQFAPGWSPQEKADSRYQREVRDAGLSNEWKEIAAIGRHSRVFGDEEDKAHTNIRKSLDRAIESIAKKDPELGAYFRKHVVKENGTFAFTDTETEWEVG